MRLTLTCGWKNRPLVERSTLWLANHDHEVNLCLEQPALRGVILAAAEAAVHIPLVKLQLLVFDLLVVVLFGQIQIQYSAFYLVGIEYE